MVVNKCPWSRCRGEAILVSQTGKHRYYCPKCGFTGPTVANLEDARLLWNRCSIRNAKTSSSCKAKGSEFEREMCKHLSLWLSKGASGDLLWRNKGQPNRRIKGARRLEQFGDAHSIDPRSAWFVNRVNLEFKFYAELDLLELLDKPEKTGRYIEAHWLQCKGDAEATERIPMLIQKRNFSEPFVTVTHRVAELLSLGGVALEIQGVLVRMFLLSSLCALDPLFVEDVLVRGVHVPPPGDVSSGVGEAAAPSGSR